METPPSAQATELSGEHFMQSMLDLIALDKIVSTTRAEARQIEAGVHRQMRAISGESGIVPLGAITDAELGDMLYEAATRQEEARQLKKQDVADTTAAIRQYDGAPARVTVLPEFAHKAPIRRLRIKPFHLDEDDNFVYYSAGSVPEVIGRIVINPILEVTHGWDRTYGGFGLVAARKTGIGKKRYQVGAYEYKTHEPRVQIEILGQPSS